MAPFLNLSCNITFPVLLFFLPASLTANFDNNANTLASTSGARCPPVPTLPESTFKVLVPNRTDFTNFVDCSDPNYVRGYSVDVFTSALSILQPVLAPQDVTYFCFYLDTEETSKAPTYDEMVNCLLEGPFDAVVGDVTIGARRLEIASFTQPYSESGTVMLAPMVVLPNGFMSVFVAPFTGHMWGSICGFAAVTAFVLWLLERHSHPEFRHVPFKQRIQKSLWFLAQIMLFLKREIIKTVLAKAVLVAWIVFIFALSSAYIASFSAILTVHKLAPDSSNTAILINSSYRIGYQKGSIVYNYLTRTLRIPDERLLRLDSSADYLSALSKGPHKDGGVAAIVDEAPYVNLFLSSLPANECSYVIVGPKLTNGGFGFAFPRGSANLSTAFSIAILKLSESGQLQKLQTGAQISDVQCPTQVQSTQLDIASSEWLFIVLGLILLGSFVMFLATLWRQSLEHEKRILLCSEAHTSLPESELDAVNVIDLESSNSSRDSRSSAHDLRKDEIMFF